MKKFKFRLDKVLDHKERLFDMAREEYLVELKKLREAEVVLSRITKEYQDCLLQLMNRKDKNFHVKELALYYKYMYFKKHEMQDQVGLIELIKKDVEQKREKLVRASQEKEILIKLKEKKKRRYEYQISMEEQKFVDDLSNAAYIRNLS